MKLILLIFWLFLHLFIPTNVYAQANSFVSVVNPLRGSDFWEAEDQIPTTAIKGQKEILTKFNIPATWLIRFDALKDKDVVDLVKSFGKDEKGIFLEITPSWAGAASVKYHESENWHEAGSAFLSGYEREERIKLIDVAFEEFRAAFGFYPKSVGAWWIDAYSLSYMQEKYGITGALIVADQYSTDNYQIWGQYFQAPYYPSKTHALHPAKSKEDRLRVVITQWASRDPVNGYGKGVEESTYSVQVNDYTTYHDLNISYFSRLIDIYTKQTFNEFGHIVVGLENSYSWDKYKDEYENQIKTLQAKKSMEQFKIVTMRNFSTWYLQTFPNLSPTHLILADDPLGTNKKVVWFMNPFYRAGWFLNEEGSIFRDIRQYVEGEEELCFQVKCDEVNFATFATRVLDDVSFGQKLVVDEGRIYDFKIENIDEKYILTYVNEAGTKRVIEFLPRDIGIDGKITSIDETILKATAATDVTEERSLKGGSFAFSIESVLLKTFMFFLFIIFALVIPGFIFTRNIFLGTVVGASFITLLFYILSYLNLRFIIWIYIASCILIFIKLRLFKKVEFKTPGILVSAIILAGTIFQILPVLRNGLKYPYGVGFWGPNAHDGVWHIALINKLLEKVPPENPIFAGEMLKNYHFFYDLLIALTSYLSNIPVADLIFRFYPVLFSIGLGVGTYLLSLKLFKDKFASYISLYLVYFAGSFGWIVEYLREGHLGGESAFWANQSISFNLNPPFAVSLLFIIAILLSLPGLKSKLSVVFVTLLAGPLIAFKAYGAILILISFILAGIFTRNIHYILVFLLSSSIAALLFLFNFSIGQKLIVFSPFWFIHSMIDSPDRVGWVRLSLARVTGMEQGNWFKFLAAEAIGFSIFLLGNLGTRVFALLYLLKIKDIVRHQYLLFIFIFSFLAFIIPTVFIQAGNPWNTIQFLYYFLYISALAAGIIITKLISKMSKPISFVFLLAVLFITPINSWATANGYLSYNPHAWISNEELKALAFLAEQNEGIVLTYPYDRGLKQRLNEPWPIFVYDSTAYVGAFSKKSVFVEDEGQNQILLTDYKKAVVASKDFFAGKDIKDSVNFLKSNSIKYIYLSKIHKISLDQENLHIKQIFENSEIRIYEVLN